jgi:hypothetical protein
MADPFEQFGGKQIQVKQDADPFQQFGGKVVPTEDSFAQFGGQQTDTPKLDSIQKEIKERGAFDKPAFIPQEIKDEELQTIAQRYNVSPEKLRNAVPLLAGLPQNITATDVVKGAAGFAGEAVGLGVPQKLFRMAQTEPEEKALDELKTLIEGRKSYAQIGAELATPGVGLVKAAKLAGGGIRGAAATGALIGTAGGFGQSKQGETLSSTAIGAGLGAGLGAAASSVASKLATRTAKRKLTSTEEKAISGLDIDKYEQQALKEMQDPANVLTEELVMGTKLPNKLSSAEIDDVLKNNYGSSLEFYLSKRPENPLLDRVDRDLASNVGFEFAAKRTLLEDIVNKERSGLLKQVTRQEFTNPETIQKEWDRFLVQGKDYVGKELNQYRKELKVSKILEDAAIYDQAPESKLGQVLGKLSDTKMHLRTIDEKWKTPTEIILDKLSQNRYLMALIRESDKKTIETIDNAAQSLGVRKQAKGGKIVDIIEGNASPDSTGEQQVSELVRNEFERIYKFVTDNVREMGMKPIDIPKVDKYVARMTKEVPEVISTLQLELVKATRQANEALGKRYKDISQIPADEFKQIVNTPAVKNLQEYINWINNANVVAEDGSRLAMVVRQSLQSDEDIRVLDKVARSSMERTATDRQIPNFIREKDIYKILDRYSQDMLSSIYQREPLSELKSYARLIGSRGGLSEAKYIENIVEDTLGVRKGTAAHFMRDIKGQVARVMNPKIEKALAEGDDTKAFVYSTLKEMVDIPSFLASQIYPNVLGWRAVPILTNALGGIARQVPELGGTYGATTYIRGLVWAKQNYAQAAQELVQKGYVPGDWNRLGQKALSDGLRASGLANIPLSALEKLNKIGMALYTKSEELNRISILGTSKMMAYDIARNSSRAQESLKKFPSSVQRAVSRAGSQEEIENILMTHLNSTIAFNYNRPALYEYGRTLGPMFSTFAKWPTAIAGEIITEYRTKPMGAATKRVAERYAAPLMAFAAVDYMMQDRVEDSERLQKLVGKSGITKAAPITAATGFVRGDIFTPPVVDTIMQDIIIPVSKAEGLAVAKGLDRAAFTYMPGAGFIKFITDDIPTFVTERRPEGSTQTERSLQSLGVTK